ncbi:hypothetical protein WJX72_001101 [[Myrmecia] bisecta]|uniref:UBA domain-containing protein n=1 Tax=[Myrmecia] bisecta TaxID=41462 RepID=A0AAW1QB51_9CHLO
MCQLQSSKNIKAPVCNVSGFCEEGPRGATLEGVKFQIKDCKDASSTIVFGIEATAAPATAAATPAPAAAAAALAAGGRIDYSTAASNMAIGPQLQATINSIQEMGFERVEIIRALWAAFNNPERAVEYLMTGIPAGVEQPQAAAPPPASGAPAAGALAGAGAAVPQQPAAAAGPNAQPLDMFPQVRRPLSDSRPRPVRRRPDDFVGCPGLLIRPANTEYHVPIGGCLW